MHISKMKQSRYLKTGDVDPEVLVTIEKVALEKIDNDSGEEKYVLYTREFDKGLVLNWTNTELTAKATGSKDSDDWMGKQVILFHDETVQFRGSVVGGIRVRAVKKKPVKQTAEPNDPIPGWDDEDPRWDDEEAVA